MQAESTHWRSLICTSTKRCAADDLAKPSYSAPALAAAVTRSRTSACKGDNVELAVVLRGFIAHLAGIVDRIDNPRANDPRDYSSNGSDERRVARG